MTDQFIHNLYSIQESCIPERVYQKAKSAFLDYLSVTIAGMAAVRQKTLIIRIFAVPSQACFEVMPLI